MENLLFVAQRVSALVMGPFVLVHLGLILYAVRGGLSAAEILQRTQGSFAWMAFYGVFVVSVAVHAPIGVRKVLIEWTRLGRKTVGALCAVFGLALLALGLRAVIAVGGWLSGAMV